MAYVVVMVTALAKQSIYDTALFSLGLKKTPDAVIRRFIGNTRRQPVSEKTARRLP